MPTLEDGEWDESTDVLTDEDLGATSPGPGEVESDSLPDTTEPQPATQEGWIESVEGEEPLPEFDPRYKDDFEGLLYLGRLTETFYWMGHEFLIQSLRTDQVLEIGLVNSKYTGTVADVKAWQAAVVAACVISVDGVPLPAPISSDAEDTELINKFNYITRSWYPLTIDAVYERYLLLEERVSKVLEATGKALG